MIQSGRTNLCFDFNIFSSSNLHHPADCNVSPVPPSLSSFLVTPGMTLRRTSNQYPHADQEIDLPVTIPASGNRNQVEAHRDLHLLTDELSNACSSVADRLYDLSRQQVNKTHRTFFA